jgi:hypothetical protein
MGYKSDTYQTRTCGHHPETCTCRDLDVRDEPKYGALEEAATNYSHDWHNITGLELDDVSPFGASILDFKAGAEWQAKQLFKDDAIETLSKGMALLLQKIDKMYSEDEVFELLKARSFDLKIKKDTQTTADWFEKNKKR